MLSKRRTTKHEALHRVDFPLIISPSKAGQFWKQMKISNQAWNLFQDRLFRQRMRPFLGGSNAVTSTLRASAKTVNSASVTQRSCASIFESVARLSSRPRTVHRAANISCVSPCWSRSFLTWGPTIFFFSVMLQKRSLTLMESKCVIAPFLERVEKRTI